MSNFVKKLRSLSAAPPVMQDGEHETQTSESSFESDEEVSLPGGESETKEKEEKEQQLRARRPSALEERREASKKKELAAFYEKFNLPETEPIVNTYSAAFMKQGLVMHGRLYMTLHHLCFYSSLFNNKSVEKIKIEDIVEFKKTFKNLTYGIQVIANDQKFNFVSFFHRDRAFILLTKLVEDHKNNTTSIENHVETSTLVPETNGGEEEGNADDDMIEDSLLEMDSAGPSEGFLNATGEMNQLVSTSFPLPVIKFFKLFFSDDSKDFTQLYHKERGDTDTVIKTWSQNAQFGNVREIQYRAPVKAPIGPNSTRCDETQRYHLTKNRLLIETVGIYYDVPFGDTFRVEGKWEITSDVNNQRQCNVVVSVSLYWIKKTWFKSKIEAGTLKETKESYELWVKLANQHLKSSSARSTLLEKTIDLDSTSISSSISSASSFSSSPSSTKTSTKTKVPIPWTRPIIFASFGILLVVLSFLGLWASVSIVFLAITGCLVYLAVSLERQILNLERRVVYLEQNQSNNRQENNLHSPLSHEHSE